MGHMLTISPADFQFESYSHAKVHRLLEVWPRGFGKSRTWSIGYPLWVLLNNPYNLDLKWKKEDLIMISNTSQLAEKWVREHKKELEHNQLLVNDYFGGDFEKYKGDIWRTDEYEIKGRGRVLAKGSGAAIRGEHPTEIIMDDLENREEARSETQREKMREYFYSDVWGTLRHNKSDNPTRVKIVGTFVHPLALLPELNGKDWWDNYRYSVYKEDGKPLWPEYLDDDGLQELRSTVPETTWASEYLNAPIVSANPMFLRRQFQPYEPGMLRGADGKKITFKDMKIFTAIDPAISQKDGADYTALSTFGVTWDKEPRIYCLDARRGHWPMSRQITELMACYERFPGSEQLIEVVAYQKALYLEYRERLERDNFNIKVHALERDKDKGRRAHVVTPLFEKSIVHFDFSDKMQQLLMDELALFDYAKHKAGRDDWVDTTVDCLTFIMDHIKRRENRAKRSKKPVIMGNYNSPIYRVG